MPTNHFDQIEQLHRRLRRVKRTMLLTDLGFLAYWIITALGIISVGSDHFLQQWNWSFLGLDLAAIGLGLTGLALGSRSAISLPMITVSLSLTSAAGLMALNFYVIRGEYSPLWWLPNLWLFGFPIAALAGIFRMSSTREPVR
ncbi:YvaD family protein [Nocardia sp. NBC_00508]|uniref:DUF5360 family protein n=1 Tax=Nocardia sp. NBC_00508 TaxID=2975992 RepID=UPI002E7FD06A|nr:DUF5360 family protein [Nocardia sp. NBC_00508]WUD66012.1 YvaD family protein [Nocardia sp. NBC_00508]